MEEKKLGQLLEENITCNFVPPLVEIGCLVNSASRRISESKKIDDVQYEIGKMRGIDFCFREFFGDDGEAWAELREQLSSGIENGYERLMVLGYV